MNFTAFIADVNRIISIFPSFINFTVQPKG